MAETELLPTSTPVLEAELSRVTWEEWVGVAHDTIAVDRTSCCVGDTVLVTWKIRSVPLHERDFIGMFEVGEYAGTSSGEVDGDHTSTPGRHVTMDGLLDSRLRGDTSISGGLIQWTMREDLFQMTGTTLFVRFCYYDHQHFLRASSSIVTVQNSSSTSHPLSPLSTLHRAISQISSPVRTQISSISCDDLRRRAYCLPDPFLKFHLGFGRGQPKLPHHGQKQISTVQYGSISPAWSGKVFVFEGLPSDVLEVEVRHKWNVSRPTTSHFLGKICIPYSIILGSQGQSTFDLQKRLPSDRVSGTISFTLTHGVLCLEGLESTSASRQQMALPELFSQSSITSQDGSCISSDEDHSPLTVLQSITGGEVGGASESDIIPVVMVTNGNAAESKEVANGIGSISPAPPSRSVAAEEGDCHGDDYAQIPLERQLSEPLQRNHVRQVLYGSTQRLGEGLIRHHSFLTRPGRSRASTASTHTPSPLTLSPSMFTSSLSPVTPPGTFHYDDQMAETLPPSELMGTPQCRPYYG